MSDLYSKEEILDHLKEMETNLLKRVFESSYSEGLRTCDLINHIKCKACELGLDDARQFPRSYATSMDSARQSAA